MPEQMNGPECEPPPANFCMRCGNRLEPGCNFCTNCGAPVRGTAAPYVAPVRDSAAPYAAPVSKDVILEGDSNIKKPISVYVERTFIGVLEANSTLELPVSKGSEPFHLILRGKYVCKTVIVPDIRKTILVSEGGMFAGYYKFEELYKR